MNEPVSVQTNPAPVQDPVVLYYQQMQLLRKPKHPVTAADKIFAVIFFIFSAVWCDFTLFHGFALGYVMAMGLFFGLMTAYLAGSGAVFRPYPLLCGVLAIAGTVPAALYQDLSLRAISFFSTVALLALYGCLTSNCQHYKPGGYRTLYDILVNIFAYPFQYMGTMLRSLFAGHKKEVSSSKIDGSKVIIGILCAVPALAVLIPLMIRSNPYFERLLTNFSIDIKQLVLRLLLGALLFPFLFTLLFTWKKGLARRDTKATPSKANVDPIIIQSFLSVLSVVYLLYLLTQTAYFFSAFRGTLPEGYDQSVTDYARRGFFEMCAIAAINLGILLLILTIVRKQNGQPPLLTRWLSLFLCVFTLLLIGTALSKMVLYIQSFGLTRLRILTSCFMVFLLLIFIAVMLRLFIRNFPYMKMMILSFCIVGLTVSYCDIDTTIARYNVTAYQNGQLETIDVEALSELSSGVVPYLLTLARDSDPQVVTDAHNALVEQFFNTFSVTCDYHDNSNSYLYEYEYCEKEHSEHYIWLYPIVGIDDPAKEDFYNQSIYPEFTPEYNPYIDSAPCNGTVTFEPLQNTDDFRGYNRTLHTAQQLLQQNAHWILIAPVD